MELNVLERLLLLNILPAEGDFTTIKIVRTLREELSFTEEEHERLQVNVSDGKVQWDMGKEVLRNFVFGNKARDLISEDLKKLNVEKKLTEQHLSLYEKFVEE